MAEIKRSLKRNYDDVGWEFGILVDPSNVDKVKCKLCGKIVRGGIYRIKQHVGHVKGNAAFCKMSSDEDKKSVKRLLRMHGKKRKKYAHEEEVRNEVILEEAEEVEGILGGQARHPHSLGPMDKFASTIDPDSSLSRSRTTRQQSIYQ